MKRAFFHSVVCLSLGAVAASAQIVPDPNGEKDDKGVVKLKSVHGIVKNASPFGGNTNGIRYHGGPVMLGTTNIYFIWYGNWSGNSATTILMDLASSIGGSPYFKINTTYYDASSTHVSNAVNYLASATDNYTY